MCAEAASSKCLVVLVESFLLKSGPAKAGPAGPGATPMRYEGYAEGLRAVIRY